MRDYTVSLHRFGITKWQMQALNALCRQYPENKRVLSEAPSVRRNRKGKTGKSPFDPDYVASVSRKKLSADVRAVEMAAGMLPKDIQIYVLLNVTQGTPYSKMNPPVGERQFRQARRAFYLWLWKFKFQ